MTRLTNEIRDRMTRDILIHANREAGEALCRESIALFDQVYADNYDAQTQALMAKLLKIHKSAFEHRNTISVNVGGYSVDIGRIRPGSGEVRFCIEPPVVPTIRSIDNRIAYLDCNIAVALKDFADRRKCFDADIKAQWERLRATFNGITTAKQLTEQWPEAMPIVARHIPEKRGQLPAIPFARLNDEFRLPPAEVSA